MVFECQYQFLDYNFTSEDNNNSWFQR